MQLVENVVRKVVRVGNRWLGRRWLEREGLTAERLAELVKTSAPAAKDTRLIFPAPLWPSRQHGPEGWKSKENGRLEDNGRAGSWVGPCKTGLDSTIVFMAHMNQPFEATRFLLNVVRTEKDTTAMFEFDVARYRALATEDPEKLIVQLAEKAARLEALARKCRGPRGARFMRRMLVGNMFTNNEIVSAGPTRQGPEYPLGSIGMDLEALGDPDAFNISFRLPVLSAGTSIGVEIHLEGEDLQEGESIIASAQFLGRSGEQEGAERRATS